MRPGSHLPSPIMSSTPPSLSTDVHELAQRLASTSYAVLLSGTHVTGKETLAVSLSEAFACTWLKAEMAHNSATFGARSQAKKGYNYSEVFGRIWLSKLQRLGFTLDRDKEEKGSNVASPNNSGPDYKAVISCYAMRKPARDAIRYAMLEHSIKPLFVIMHITKDTLSGRTLGAEEPGLAEKIMGEKMKDVEEPLAEEKDVILIDSLRDVDTLFQETKEGITRQVS
ncbi:hypothetical protein B0T25DRAFT_136479 [Lasiosphaeria hispida]|uniref:Uncharacterized protein n=1 Tax=Lasiosphaeria hispida TaxID=260671 RepID=A0AAJ0HKX7_9PEZI|nr:hypothetical protein B0T25DRAFT_136479 [Lasiosphaeria hispida]